MPGTRLAVRNPRTGRFDYAVDAWSLDALNAATARLRLAGPRWRARPLVDRIAALKRLREALDQATPALVASLEVDTGRRALAYHEVAAVMRAITAWGDRAPGLLSEDWKSARSAPALRYRTQWCPYPLVGVISPWNFPLLLSFVDAIPALLAGCTVLLKPSEVTPRWIAPFEAAVATVPELAEVLAIVVGGAEIGAAVVDRVDAVCFTGSIATGATVAVRAATRMIPASLELGGKDPLLILASAPLDRAVAAALRGAVAATGQACQSIERIYVARSLCSPFVEQLVIAAEAVKLNWPDIGSGDIGPIIYERQAAILERQLADAVAKGARILCGGTIEHHGGGLWMRPTVLVDVDHSMQVMTEESFGPLMPVMAFGDETEAVRLANDSVYGLSAAVMAGTLEEAEAVARHIDAGAVSLNDTALTAVFFEAAKDSFKQSGLGRSRMGAAGFERFFRAKALIAQDGEPAAIKTLSEHG